jgi:hypothetical protein
MKCPKCKTENPSGSQFCGGCGQNLKIENICQKCRHLNPEVFKFCNKRGQILGEDARSASPPISFHKDQPQAYTPKHLAEKILTNRSTLDGERKLVTVLFADVASFTSMPEEIDPKEDAIALE